jgi:hypothetical protein
MAAIVVDDALRGKLRYVKLPARDGVLGPFPDFLIAGPQRTGTTWLHANLRFHPEIMLSRPKEIFFFSRLKTPEHPKFRSAELEWYLRFFREPAWWVALKHAVCLWRYGQTYRPRVRGEATASYAALDPDVIREVAALNPRIKVILMIRDPVERAWSHAKKDLARNRGRDLRDVSRAEFEQFFRDEYQRRCARYVEQYENWSAHLLPGHVAAYLFDDISRRPESLLLEVMAFLGVAADPRYVSPAARKAVNPTGGAPVPDEYRRFLEDLLREEIRAVRERFGSSR